eukprot:TRINITY_DN66486_c5_g3_i4.p1 TRINITY_DN66486_c5_g3~~TRINITY_DN66486_c5_g3_i4.p1  ORF type:complete len:133 (+),score=15.44 TRINITY_DN66486_c5_g3_i4:83-481(+)
MSKWRAGVVVVKKDNKVMIMRRGATAPWKPGFWNFPGGMVDEGETPEQAAYRELTEEAGIVATSLSALGERVVEDGMVYAYLCTEYTGTPKLVVCPELGFPENDAIEWVDVHSVANYPSVDGLERLVKVVLG